ncbi:hypothetical protein PSQ39_19240 [Curvibacter sp. HBC28]|uniref:DUF2946 domain-containing protein n=1 Tax=Curvibacter microcysteis TaxID=3026419 RepID=A0ABT5MJL9_9BURK|nr:DUF2946 family protein [Curvibacter sp. HBC28]MDD0816777.1 hypothetical protein [Curvibacter sp. HBC28]
MRRLWMIRFAWLLCLASLGTAVLPLAHDLSHRHGLPVLLGAVAHSAEADSGSQVDAHAPSEGEAEICLVCAHLCSQHLSLPQAPNLPALCLPSAAPPPLAASPAPTLQTAWLRPAPRAPPTSFSL